MRIVKPSLYVALGMILGIAVTVIAETPRQSAASRRMSETTAGSVHGRPAVFVKDAKSGACWLAVGYTTGELSPTIAVAPAAACEP